MYGDIEGPLLQWRYWGTSVHMEFAEESNICFPD